MLCFSFLRIQLGIFLWAPFGCSGNIGKGNGMRKIDHRLKQKICLSFGSIFLSICLRPVDCQETEVEIDSLYFFSIFVFTDRIN